MASSSQSRKVIVVRKYRTELHNALTRCIEDVLPDLERVGAISIEQRAKVREYVEGKMPANAVDYLLDDHIKKSTVETTEDFLKLLKVVMAAGAKSSPQCKALAKVIEGEVKINIGSEVDEITKWMQSLGHKKTKELQEMIERRLRRWKNWQNREAPPASGE